MNAVPASDDSCAPAAVECYSGTTYAQEPRTVVWQGQRQAVSAVESRWRLPAGPAFRVRTEQGKRFELHYHQAEDDWSVRRIWSP